MLHRISALPPPMLFWLLLLPWPGLEGSPQQPLVLPPGSVESHCLPRMFWLKLNQAFLKGKDFSLELVDPNGWPAVPLEAELASRCGYVLSSDVWGNPVFRASLLSCHVMNWGDEWFSLGVHIKVSRFSDPLVTYVHTMHCTYSLWAPREILCEENYMEVSVKVDVPKVSEAKVPEQRISRQWMDTLPEAQEAAYKTWQMVFYPPTGRKIMAVSSVSKLGYGFNHTGSRVFLRSPYSTNESETTLVEGVPVTTVRSTALYKRRWLLLLIDTTVSCPVGGLSFTPSSITWVIPSILPSLTLQPSAFRSENVSLGVDGQRVAEAASHGYGLSSNMTHIEVTIPVGARGGWSQSDILHGHYGTTYSIDLLLEHTWTDSHWHLTKLLMIKPITTPFMAQTLMVTDNTVPETRLFKVLLGSVLPHDQLVAVVVGRMSYAVVDSEHPGYNVLEIPFPNGTKGFLLDVPFDDPNVLKEYVNRNETKYTLLVDFTLSVGPQQKPFHQAAEVECILEDVELPQATGTCDGENMVLTIPMAGLQLYWYLYVGNQRLSPTSTLPKGYLLTTNATHLLLKVAVFSKGLAYEDVSLQSIQVRLDVALKKADTLETLDIFSVSCDHRVSSDFILCFPNGTIAVSALMMTDPSIDMGKATLKDRTCKPRESLQDRSLFWFHITNCGTSVRVESGHLIYENEITYEREALPRRGVPTITRDPEYRLTLLCYYQSEEMLTQVLRLGSNPRGKRPLPYGDGTMVQQAHVRGPRRARQTLEIQWRISKDPTFSVFYGGDAIAMKQTSEPLFFEVELMNYEGAPVELLLDKCWMSVSPKFHSQPQWNVVVNRCGVKNSEITTDFCPVDKSGQVKSPSLVKRLMVRHTRPAPGQVYLHCLTLVCPEGAPYGGQCPLGWEEADQLSERGYVAMGPIVLQAPDRLPAEEEVPARPGNSFYQAWLWLAVGILVAVLAFLILPKGRLSVMTMTVRRKK
ncbi:uncharacterized protein [Notamacropus eugenii]|uniref:uncharacterized protein isoform X2 n=1 Tax=Notamacropus eugenii TaxID=9315 RepID=UPI003B67582F